MNRSILTVLVGLSVMTAGAEPLRIIGFETESGIAFEGATVSNYYTLEFAASPSGPWTNWGSVTEQSITGTVMSAPSPFFYRIKQTDSSAFPPYAVVGHVVENCAAYTTNSKVAVWDRATGTWTEHDLDGPIEMDGEDEDDDRILGSEDNFAAMTTQGNFAVWDRTTGTWTNHALGGSCEGFEAGGGSFGAISASGLVVIWDSATRTWREHNLGGVGRDLDANVGSFAAINTTGKIVVWDHTRSAWTEHDLGGTTYGLSSLEADYDFGAMNTTGGVAVWDSSTGSWKEYHLGGASRGIISGDKEY